MRGTWAVALAVLVLAGTGCGAGAGQTGTLEVTVRYAGGPAVTANGGTLIRPVGRAEVEVSGTGTGISAIANMAGVAAFRLPAGRYSLSVPTCGSTLRVAVTVRAARSTSFTWWCPIT